jgi:hypothetical protein
MADVFLEDAINLKTFLSTSAIKGFQMDFGGRGSNELRLSLTSAAAAKMRTLANEIGCFCS